MTSTASKSGRLPHIEFLRVLCMFFIVGWHAVMHGAFGARLVPVVPYADTPMGELNLLLLNLLFYLTGVAVDTYVLITGYFLVNARFRWQKVCSVWTQAWFYSALLVGVAALCFPDELSAERIVLSLLPLVPGQDYWFVTAYLGLLVLSPYLALVATSLGRKEYRNGLLVLGMMVLSFSKYLPYGNHYYSPLLLFIFLFFIAGYIRRFRPSFRLWGKERYGALYLAGCAGLALLTTAAEWGLYRQEGTFVFFTPSNKGFSLPLACCLFLWALRFRVRRLWMRQLVRLAPYTFGVYLMHDGTLMRTFLWDRLFVLRNHLGEWWLVPCLLAVVVGVFAVCAAIDALRAALFRRWPLDVWLFVGLCRVARWGKRLVGGKR